mmetsp:Transcript_93948/g.289728  ORF Transcript_93948/g.289728 Transcript_93948/m.289728 type:complete len:351 (-) Transcript_93948:2494-3546(-)
MACTSASLMSSALSSASNGTATFDAFSMSPCNCLRLVWASSTSFFATKRCSRSVNCLESFASSTWHCVSLVCSLVRSAVTVPRMDSANVLASWSRSARNFLASMTAAFASPSTCPISSQTLRASSAEMSAILESSNLFTVSASFCTAASTPAIFSPEACIWVLRLRSAVSFLSSASFAAAASSFFWRARSSLVHISEGASENCLASTSFCTTNVRASVIDFCAEPAAASHATMALLASEAGRDSMPFRKGSSLSEVFWTSASACSTFSTAWAMSSAACSRSFCSVAAFTTVPSFLSAAEMRERMPVSSSLRKPCALFSFTSMSLAVALSLVLAEVVALSMRSTASAEGWS